MPERSYRLLLWGLALTGLALDQATKYGVFAWLEGVPSHTWAVAQFQPERAFFRATDPVYEGGEAVRWGFFLDVRFEGVDDAGRRIPGVNHGALFGFMSKRGGDANLVFAGISLLAAGAIVYWSTQRATARDRWLCAALGLILGGTLGNFYDRLRFNGVRDFLHWNYLYDWPVFNVADCCLVCGAGLLLVQAFLAPAQQPAQEEGAAVAVTCGAGAATTTKV